MWTLFYDPIKTTIITETISYKFLSPFSKFPSNITLLFPSHSLNNPLHIKNMIILYIFFLLPYNHKHINSNT